MTCVRQILAVGLAVLASPAFSQMAPTPQSATSAAAATRAEARDRAKSSFDHEYGTKVLLKNDVAAHGYSAASTVASCVAKRAKGDAGALLGGPLTSDPGYEKLTKALGRKYDMCVSPDAVGLSMDVINSALAEELVRQAKPTLDDRAKGVDVAAVKAFYADPAGRTLDSIGRCLAAYSPGLAYHVLTSATGTPGESAALAALYAQSPECGVPSAPEGFTAQDQRAVIATGLYYWTHRA